VFQADAAPVSVYDANFINNLLHLLAAAVFWSQKNILPHPHKLPVFLKVHRRLNGLTLLQNANAEDGFDT